MMMDHHRFIKPSTTSNVMIGSSQRNSDGTDDFDPLDPATMDESLLSSPIPAGPSSVFGEDVFADDKISMNFDDNMAFDLDTSNPPSSSYAKSGGISSDNSVSSDVYLEKMMNSDLGGGEFRGMNSPENNTIGVSSKVGDIGDELDMDLLADVINSGIGDNTTSPSTTPVPVVSGENSMRELQHNQDLQGPGESADSSINHFLKAFPDSKGNQKGNADTSIDKSIEQLINIPIINLDNHKPDHSTSSGDRSNNHTNGSKNDTNTTNISLSLKNSGDSVGSLCDSIGSLPSIGVGNLVPNESFSDMQQSRLKQQQQENALLMKQQQILQLQLLQSQQKLRGNISSNNQKNTSIRSIVNNQLPQANQMTNLGAQALEQQKLQLIKKLEEIERSNMPMNNTGQQQRRQQQQTQKNHHQQQPHFLIQQQLLLEQQQNQLRLQQKQLQQNIMSGGQLTQGQLQSQGQQQQQQQQQANMGFVNQQMMQQGAMASGLMSPRPFAMGSSQTPFSQMNISNNGSMNSSGQQQQQSSMFANVIGNNNSNMNNSNNSQTKANVSSVMGSKGKETPLMSFLRDKSGVNNARNMMSMTSQQQQLSARSLNSSNRSLGSDCSSILDATPMDLNTNPFLRKQMMNNLDKSVNPGNRRGVHALTGSGLSSTTRRNMMQQMSSSLSTTSFSKSAHDLRNKKSASDFYENAGIVARPGSADNVFAPGRRTSLTAGAAKAQNRRLQTLRRSSNSSSSFGNLGKGKGSRRDVAKGGAGNSTRSLPCKSGATSSTQSLSSGDSTSSLLGRTAKRRGSGVKHKLGTSGSARRLSFQHLSGSAAALQQQREDQQYMGPKQNDGWP